MAGAGVDRLLSVGAEFSVTNGADVGTAAGADVAAGAGVAAGAQDASSKLRLRANRMNTQMEFRQKSFITVESAHGSLDYDLCEGKYP